MKPTHTQVRLPQPRPTVARVVFALSLGTAIAVGLYLWMGRMDPVPPWIAIPNNARLVDSRMNPNGSNLPGVVQYYLQISIPGTDVKSEMERFALGIDGVQWYLGGDSDSSASSEFLPTRAMSNDDVFQRIGYPAWVQDKMFKSKSQDGAWRLQSQGGMEQIDLFGWPGETGECIIELVWKTGGLSALVEDPEETDPEE